MSKGLEFFSVAKAFSEIGLSLKTVFPDYEIAVELYKHHNWYVYKKDGYTVVHAVPLIHLLDTSFWEHWSAIGVEPAEHQVLFRKTPPVTHYRLYDAGSKENDINPGEVSGSIWYVIEVDHPRGWALNIL